MRLFSRVGLACALAVVVVGFGGTAAPAAAEGHQQHHRSGVVWIGGSVDAPARFTLADLAALPQTTLVDQRKGPTRSAQLTGVLLQTLIDQARPQLPAGAKNGTLRVTATVLGRHGPAVSAAWGELDVNFGNHPALLVLSRDGQALRHAPALVFPGDTNTHRTVESVRSIEVQVAATGSGTTPAAGDVVVTSGRRSVVVTATRLAALPQVTTTVTYLASGVPQTRTETGPKLATVLQAARVPITSSTSVAASAADGYVAAVTPGESSSGGRTLLLSLVEDGQPLTRPRLVPAGDVRGGRYVSDVTTLTVDAGRCR